MEYLTTVEMSEKWGITSRRIGVLCAEGRIDGTVKKGKTWLIPSTSEKPADARRKCYHTIEKMTEREVQVQ